MIIIEKDESESVTFCAKKIVISRPSKKRGREREEYKKLSKV